MKQAFTLIELLVVVLIIGILSAIALPQYQKAVRKSRWVQLQVLGRALQDAVDRYYLANGTYPISLEGLDIELSGTLSRDKRGVTAEDKYYCYLDVRNEALDSLWCQTTGDFLAYRVRYWGSTRNRDCVAHDNNNTMKAVCIAVGGINPYDNGIGLIHYTLP